jgi:hypothetical protein
VSPLGNKEKKSKYFLDNNSKNFLKKETTKQNQIKQKEKKTVYVSCWKEILIFAVFCPSCHSCYGNSFRRVDLPS